MQAWQAMKQGDDTQKQNVTLLVFTVVTVVFVSLRSPLCQPERYYLEVDGHHVQSTD